MSDQSPAPLLNFSPSPYQADGDCPVGGLIVLGIVVLFGGPLLGVVAGMIPQVLVMTPCFVAIGLCCIGWFAVKKGKVRMPLLSGAVGFLAGCFVVVSTHFYNYYLFEKELADIPTEEREAAANFTQLQSERADLSPELQDFLDLLADDPELREGLAVRGIFDYVDMMAREGLSFTRGRGRKKQSFNLGYIGTYAYWGFEAFLIGGFAFALMKKAAEQPFCAKCESWKVGELVGGFDATTANVKGALISGDLHFLDEFATPVRENL